LLKEFSLLVAFGVGWPYRLLSTMGQLYV
jgi:hypothetical protein